MSERLRRTPAMLDLLRVLLAADEPVWGLRLSKDTGRPTGTVYPLLERLEAAGHVESGWDDQQASGASGARRRLYRFTDSGRGWAREQMAHAGLPATSTPARTGRSRAGRRPGGRPAGPAWGGVSMGVQ